ncbi:hypothetical protein [Flavobacterium terrisoli]|uniref:hypothetical protein n=1 Tax=Flavobacterium terrisoli TaxID=3242195 RepID=UPI002543DF82|nr:hypothetical protein [Flavobacterium buctense]
MKTNFLNKLKQGLFLLIAVLGTFIGYSQSTTTITIGGSKTPDTGGLLDIGGNQRPTPTLLTNLVSENLDTGGGSSTTKPPITLPFTLSSKETQCMFAFDIGGRGTSSDTGQVNDDDDPFDIGGNGGVIIGRPGIGGNRPPVGEYCLDTDGRDSSGGLLDIGGRQDVPTLPFSNFSTTYCTFAYLSETGGGGKGTSSGTGEVNDPNDIGGRGTGTDAGTGQYITSDIGGRNSGGEYAMFDDGETVVEYDLVYIPKRGCVFDTGGRNGTGTSTGGDYDDDTDDDTGGRGSNGTIGEISEPPCYLTANLN